MAEHNINPVPSVSQKKYDKRRQVDEDVDDEFEIIDLDDCSEKFDDRNLDSSDSAVDNENCKLLNDSNSNAELFIVYEEDQKLTENSESSVTLDSACQSLIQVISYLQANPSLAGNHLQTFWLILEKLQARQKEMMNNIFGSENEMKSELCAEDEVEEVFIMDKYDDDDRTSEHGILVLEDSAQQRNIPSKKRKLKQKSEASSTSAINWNETQFIAPKSDSDNIDIVDLNQSETVERKEPLVLDPVLDIEVARYITEKVLQATRAHQCDVCHQRFESAVELKYHIKKLHIRSGQYKCNMCAEKFPDLRSLAWHSQFHYGDHEFQCSVCGRCCHSNASLHTHKRSHMHQLRRDRLATQL